MIFVGDSRIPATQSGSNFNSEDLSRLKATLAENPLLKHLAPERLGQLAGVATLVTLAPGQDIFGEGRTASSILVVLTGSGTVRKGGVEKARVSIGQLLGIHALTGEKTRQATITADTQTRLAEIGLGHLQRMMDENQSFADAVRAEQQSRAKQLR